MILAHCSGAKNVGYGVDGSSGASAIVAECMMEVANTGATAVATACTTVVLVLLLLNA